MNKAIAWWNNQALSGTKGQPPGISRRIYLVNQMGLTIALISLFFTITWALQANLPMVLGNLAVGLIHFLTPWLNRKGFYNLSRYSMLFWLPTFLFVFVGMVGRGSEIHTCFYSITAFSCLLFDPKEKLKLLISVLYPVTLFGILLYHDFHLFPNLIGPSTADSSALNYFVNFLLVSLSMFYLFRASEKFENQYKTLYEKHIEAQRLLDEERARAIYSMRMAALGEMAGGIAHEINSPLNVITILSEQLQKRIPEKAVSDTAILEAVTKINTTANRIGSIVNSLRSISRTGEGLPVKDTHVDGIIQETLILCRERFRSREITVTVPDLRGLPMVRCRNMEISQVLLNLLNNACDALEGVPAPQIDITVWVSGPFLSIGVSDNGPGIAAPIREKIFAPFFTTKDIGKGTGLGLSLSRGLVEANKGRLYLGPDLQKTQFIIELKLAEAA